jgi:2-amino-4-hydroxy-6-hydroxymethyldihydropteridine diphosphokinase
VDQRVFVGIGSNVGDSASNSISSIERLREDKRVKLLSVSSLYVTTPVSSIRQNDFINCAVSILWGGSPFELLRLLNRIEHEMGRVRGVKNGPRVIDLDILLFGDLILETPSLTVPHPELHKRKFAIIPCIEIDPFVVHPVYKRELKEFLPEIRDEQKIQKLTDTKDSLNFH